MTEAPPFLTLPTVTNPTKVRMGYIVVDKHGAEHALPEDLPPQDIITLSDLFSGKRQPSPELSERLVNTLLDSGLNFDIVFGEGPPEIQYTPRFFGDRFSGD